MTCPDSGGSGSPTGTHSQRFDGKFERKTERMDEHESTGRERDGGDEVVRMTAVK